jgi:allantoin racemase
MRILVANANTTMAITELCAASARAAAAPGTQIIPATPGFGPVAISTRAENVVAGHAILDLLARHAGQVDGVLLAVSLDSGLDGARQMMPCPVVGMTEAACLTACLLGGRFGLATLGNPAPFRDLVEGRHGLAARLAGCVGLGVTPLEALDEPGRAEAELEAAIDGLVGQGADAVVIAGAALAGMAPRLQPRAPVPLLDGIACGVKLLEGLAALRLPKPGVGSYAESKGRMTVGLDGALARLLRG